MKVVHPTVEDVNGIYSLVDNYAKTGIIIQRSKDDITKNINDFRVIKIDSIVVACVCIYIYNQNLAELRTLVVDPNHHRKGIGSHLVVAIKKLAHELKINKLFTLTMEVDFFKKNGFEILEMSKLPEKIYKDCDKCRIKHNCKETAMFVET